MSKNQAPRSLSTAAWELSPSYRDTGCAVASSCLNCHLARCAEDPVGEAEATLLLRRLRHQERSFDGKASGPPPPLPPSRRRDDALTRRLVPTTRPRTVRESADRLGVSRRKWYRLYGAGLIPPGLVPDGSWGKRPAAAGEPPDPVAPQAPAGLQAATEQGRLL